MTTHLAAELRRLRLARGWRLQDAANAAQMSLAHISDIERGRGEPTLSSVERLLAAYGHRLIIASDEIEQAARRPLPRLLDEV